MLWDEIHICNQHLGYGYQDILSMPTGERRYYLSLLSRDYLRKKEQLEEARANATVSKGKGVRTTRLSGQALKNKLNSGEIT